MERRRRLRRQRQHQQHQLLRRLWRPRALPLHRRRHQQHLPRPLFHLLHVVALANRPRASAGQCPEHCRRRRRNRPGPLLPPRPLLRRRRRRRWSAGAQATQRNTVSLTAPPCATATAPRQCMRQSRLPPERCPGRTRQPQRSCPFRAAKEIQVRQSAALAVEGVKRSVYRGCPALASRVPPSRLGNRRQVSPVVRTRRRRPVTVARRRRALHPSDVSRPPSAVATNLRVLLWMLFGRWAWLALTLVPLAMQVA